MSDKQLKNYPNIEKVDNMDLIHDINNNHNQDIPNKHCIHCESIIPKESRYCYECGGLQQSVAIISQELVSPYHYITCSETNCPAIGTMNCYRCNRFICRQHSMILVKRRPFGRDLYYIYCTDCGHSVYYEFYDDSGWYFGPLLLTSLLFFPFIPFICLL